MPTQGKPRENECFICKRVKKESKLRKLRNAADKTLRVCPPCYQKYIFN